VASHLGLQALHPLDEPFDPALSAPMLATVLEQAGGGVGIERGGYAGRSVVAFRPVEQHTDLFGDPQRLALGKRAPLARLLFPIVLVEAEPDQFILADRIGDSGELRDGGPSQLRNAVKCGMEFPNLLGAYRAHILRREIQRLVVEIEAQPLPRVPADVDILAQHAKEFLRFIDHVGQLLQRHTYSAAIELHSYTQTSHGFLFKR
jgi:hypothetical protein